MNMKRTIMTLLAILGLSALAFYRIYKSQRYPYPAPRDLRLSLPLCGTLTSQGYAPLAFLVPERPDRPAVRRFEAEGENLAAPLEVYAGWWVCVTEGTIEAPPAGSD